MNKIITMLLVIFLACTSCKFRFTSGEAPPFATGEHLKVWTQDHYDIDEEYAEKYKISVPAPFSFAVMHKPREKRVPTEDGLFLIGFDFFKNGTTEVVEKISMYKNAIPMAEEKSRIQALETLLKTNPLLKETLQRDHCGIPTFEKITRANFSGMVLSALCSDKKKLFKFYGILNPNNENGVSIKAYYDLLQSEVHDSNEVFDKGAIAHILRTFRFLPRAS